MARSFTYDTTLCFGNDEDAGYCEVDCRFSYSVSWGAPETPPAYSHGGLPAEPAMVEDCELVAVDGKPRPWAKGFGFITDDDFSAMCTEKVLDKEEDVMIAEASDTMLGEHDAARERDWEDSREDRRGY